VVGPILDVFELSAAVKLEAELAADFPVTEVNVLVRGLGEVGCSLRTEDGFGAEGLELPIATAV